MESVEISYDNRAMRNLLFVVVVVVLSGARHVSADEAGLDARTRDLMAALEAADDASRDAVVAEVVALGHEATPFVVQHLPLEVTPVFEEALADAFVRMGVEQSIAFLRGYRSRWAYSVRREVEGILSRLEAARDPELTRSVPLEPDVLDRYELVPPLVEHAVNGSIPAALAGVDVLVHASRDELRVDATGDGSPETRIKAKKPQVFRVGDRKTGKPVIAYVKHDGWFAASASIGAAKADGVRVEVLDADLDGTFASERDHIRFGSGVFRPVREGELATLGDALVRYRIVEDDGGVQFEWTLEPIPSSATKSQLATLRAVNEWRNGAGLVPKLLDLQRSKACQLHVDYWKQNGFSGHGEDPSKPGYTEEGREAGIHSSCSTGSDPVKVSRWLAATILHRMTLLSAAQEGLGVGYGSGSCLAGGDIDTSAYPFPVLAPGPGCEGVPTRLASESPDSDRVSGLYESPRGYPVTVTSTQHIHDMKDVSLRLFRVGKVWEPVEGFLFTPQQPYYSGRPMNRSSAYFVAKEPLAKRQAYYASFSGVAPGQAFQFGWFFKTK